MKSVHFNNIILWHNFSDFISIKVGSCNVKHANSFSNNRFLSLNFEVKFDICLFNKLYWFFTSTFAVSFEFSNKSILCWITNHSENKVVTNEDNSFSIFLQISSKLWQEGEIESWGISIWSWEMIFFSFFRSKNIFDLKL